MINMNQIIIAMKQECCLHIMIAQAEQIEKHLHIEKNTIILLINYQKLINL